MSPSMPRRARSGIAGLALVSVLHTSVAAWAQAPAQAPSQNPASPAQTAPPASAAPSGATAPAPAGTPPGGTGAAASPPGTVAAPLSEADVAATRERARAAYGAGQDAYAAGQYAAAAAHFERADELLPAIQAKYWRAMSLDKLGDAGSAYAAFGLVLADAQKNELGPEKLETAAARQRSLSLVPAQLDVVSTPPGAHLQVSGVEIASPTPLSLRIAPGRHVLVVSLPGYESQRLEIVATPGAKLTPNLTLLATAPAPAAGALSAPPTEPLANPARSRVPGYVTLGIAGASAIVGTIYGIKALGAKSDFNDAPSTRKADDTERNALIADMAFGVTLTLGITGLVLLLTEDSTARAAAEHTPSQHAGLRVAPYVSPNGAGAAAALTF